MIAGDQVDLRTARDVVVGIAANNDVVTVFVEDPVVAAAQRVTRCNDVVG